MDAKNTAFPGNKEVHRAWLQGTRRVVNLLKGKNKINLNFGIMCAIEASSRLFLHC